MRPTLACVFVLLGCGSEFSDSERRTDVATDAGELADAAPASSSGGRGVAGATAGGSSSSGGRASAGGRGAGGASSGGSSSGGATGAGGASSGGSSSGGATGAGGVDRFNCTTNEECEAVPGRPPETVACCGGQLSPAGWHRCGFENGLDCYGF